MGDSAELLSAAVQWGVPHPPGYPLYTLIAHMFARLPLFETAFRVHLTSALFHAATVGAVALIVDLVTGSLTAAAIAAGALALGRIFLAGSLYAEVFPLNDLFFAILLYLALTIARADPADDNASRWALMATFSGLAAAHHHMIALAFPALAILVAKPLMRFVRKRPARSAALAVATIAIPASFYALLLYVASRHPLASWGDVRDVADLVRLVTRQDYGGTLHASRHVVAGQTLDRLDIYFSGVATSLGVVGTLLALVGVAAAFRADRRMAIALVAAFVCAGPLFAVLNAFDVHSAYRVAFFERFATMSLVPIAALLGVGAAALDARARANPRIGPRVARAMSLAVAAVTVAPLAFAANSVDFHNDALSVAYAHDLVTSSPDDALLLLKGDMASQASLYVCAVEQRCGHRIILAPGQLWMPWKRRELAERYPALPLPPAAAPSKTRWLALTELSRRPVLVHPELVGDLAPSEMTILPSALLFRVYANEGALRDDLPRFREEAKSLATSRQCEGCSLSELSAPGTDDVQLSLIYDAALRSYEASARNFGLFAEADAIAARFPKKSR
jgi:hypothetical protein